MRRIVRTGLFVVASLLVDVEGAASLRRRGERWTGRAPASASAAAASLPRGPHRKTAATSGTALLDRRGPSAAEGFAHLLATLKKFQGFASSSRSATAARHAAEAQALQQAVDGAGNEEVRLALMQSVNGNKASLKETTRIYDEMANFSAAMGQVLKASAGGTASTCEQLVCGERASCTMTLQGAKCICNEGYVGLGQDCHPPPEFLPRPLIRGNSAVRAEDMYVNVFETNHVVVVYRNVAVRGSGWVVVGRVRDAGIAVLTPPEQFTVGNGQAYSPIAVGTTSKRLVLAWRDAARLGTCWARGARLGGTGIRGADMAITWGEPVHFCAKQSHKMAMVALPQDKFALMYSDRGASVMGTPESFGNSVLASVSPAGKIDIVGQFRFSDEAVCRLEVTKLTPTAFVVAARAGKALDEAADAANGTRQEAMAMFAEVVGSELTFDPNPANLEPETPQMWARDVSLVAPDRVAYAYQDGTSMSIKLAVLEVDSARHLKVVQAPMTIHKGFSPYVASLSVPYTVNDPHTVIYYEDQATKTSMINVCSWSNRSLTGCEDFSWLNQPVASFSVVRLGSAKSFVTFTTEGGVPYYGVIGLSKK